MHRVAQTRMALIINKPAGQTRYYYYLMGYDKLHK
jgi:hypothetical protein